MNTRKPAGILIVVICATWMTAAHSQKTTEIYIPIGYSPGVSASTSLQGEISRMDYESRRIELVDRSGTQVVHMSDATLYYLDRSKYGKKNSLGSIRDCQVGQQVEIYVMSNGDVQWIKIASD